jgi:hypothetical protein
MINIIYEKKYANGLIDYTDSEGNIIDYTDTKYTDEEEWYIDTTPEERRAYAAQRLETQRFLRESAARRGRMFDSPTLNPSPKERDFPSPPAPLPGGEGRSTPSPLRGTPTDASVSTVSPTLGGEFKQRQPLWGKYWAERELCLLAGDTGTGKTLLALNIAKQLAGGCVLGNDENVGKPRKVLYVDFELDREGFEIRLGNGENRGEVLSNLYWAGYNQKGVMPKTHSDACAWMLDTIQGYLQDTEAEVLIIDQPDRLHIAPQRWRELLFALKKLIAERGIAVMLIVNTKPRNYARPMELSHINNYAILGLAADCIVGIGMNYNDWLTRYIKPFKLKNRALNRSEALEGFVIDGQGGFPPARERDFDEEEYTPSPLRGTPTDASVSTVSPTLGGEIPSPPAPLPMGEGSFYTPSPSTNVLGTPPPEVSGAGESFSPVLQGEILQIILTVARDEEDFLKPTKTKIKEQKMIAAEKMRKCGLPVDHIAIELDLPECIVKRWVRGIKVISGEGRGVLSFHPSPSPPPRERGFDDDEYTPSPSANALGTPPWQGESLYIVYDKPEELSDEEWAVCVNNPASVYYDEFAYNPYLIERERREMGRENRLGVRVE